MQPTKPTTPPLFPVPEPEPRQTPTPGSLPLHAVTSLVLLPPTARRLWWLLATDRTGTYATATNDQFAELLQVTTRTITAALTVLVTAGLLAIDTRRGHPATDPAARTLTLTPGRKARR